MSNTANTTATAAADCNLKTSVLSNYKYHFVSFLKGMDKLNEYISQLEAIDKREELTKGLMSQLDNESAAYLAKDFEFERDCAHANIEDQQFFLAKKCEKLIVAAAKMEEIGLPVAESVITMAKVFINA